MPELQTRVFVFMPACSKLAIVVLQRLHTNISITAGTSGGHPGDFGPYKPESGVADKNNLVSLVALT
jgi:hypothetical protein